MCHPALTTGMERIKVLSALRLPEIVLPQCDQLTAKEVIFLVICHLLSVLLIAFFLYLYLGSNYCMVVES